MKWWRNRWGWLADVGETWRIDHGADAPTPVEIITIKRRGAIYDAHAHTGRGYEASSDVLPWANWKIPRWQFNEWVRAGRATRVET